MKPLDAVRTTIGQLEEIHSLLRASRSDLIHAANGFDSSGSGWITPLTLESASDMLMEASKRIAALYKGSPHDRYGRYKNGENGLNPWKEAQ